MLDLRFAEELPALMDVLRENALPTWLTRDRKVTFANFFLKNISRMINFLCQLMINLHRALKQQRKPTEESDNNQKSKLVQDWLSNATQLESFADAFDKTYTQNFYTYNGPKHILWV